MDRAGRAPRNRGRRPWLCAAWKMNKTRAEAVPYLRRLAEWADGSALDADVAVCPPFTALAASADTIGSHRGDPSLVLAAQNMHWQDSGARTGEISAAMLIDCGVTSVQLGHFERRRYFGETDESVNRKLTAALAAGLDAIVCVGETSSDLAAGVAAETVSRQVKIALHGLEPRQASKVVVAYEPGWAVGVGGRNADPRHAEAMHGVVRAAVRSRCGPNAEERVRVVYGGSVDADSAATYARGTGLDGLLVGRAALDVERYIAIVERFCGTRAPSALAAKVGTG